jgi:AraC-like DNA-binding protein
VQTGYWSTEAAQHSDHAVYWRQAICEAIFELDFQAASKAVSAHLRQYQLGAVKLSEISISTGHEVIRSREAAARGLTPRFNLNYIRTGSWSIAHHGRNFTLSAGELVLFDNRRPYHLRAESGTEHICVHLPVEWLRCWMPDPESGIAVPISRDMPWQRTLTALLEDAVLLADRSDDCNDLCAQQIAGALSLALGPTRKAAWNSRSGSHSGQLLLRIKNTIGDMFCDPELDASAVATALNISPRYLHKVLARQGTTYGAELIRLRLERSQQMLADRRFDLLPVAEVGFRCGFCDPSHFSRRFKQATGVNPGAYRESRQGLPQ